RDAERVAMGLPDRAPEFPYAEHVNPWIRSMVEDGDRARRLGEDRLFSSEEPAWARSLESLATAREAYRNANLRARSVRSASAVRLGKEDWVAATGAAAVAFSDADDLPSRKVLWDRLDAIASADFEAFDKPPAVSLSGDDRANALRRHRIRSRVQGRMALAVL